MLEQREFRTDLETSRRYLAKFSLVTVLRQRFPNLVAIHNCDTDLGIQRRTTDFILELASETFLYLEEKLQKEDTDHWRLPLEVWSSWPHHKNWLFKPDEDLWRPHLYDPWETLPSFRAAPGWCAKPALASWYLFDDHYHRVSWLMDMQGAQAVLRRCYPRWLKLSDDCFDKYAVKQAGLFYFAPTDNITYETWNMNVAPREMQLEMERSGYEIHRIPWNSLPSSPC